MFLKCNIVNVREFTSSVYCVCRMIVSIYVFVIKAFKYFEFFLIAFV